MAICYWQWPNDWCCISGLQESFWSCWSSNILIKIWNIWHKNEALKWFKTYLSQKRQQAYVNNHKSDIRHVLYGVPQGFILESLLFLLFIHDLPLYVNNWNTDLYTDDTNLYDIQNSEDALESLNTWYKSNGMLLD